ncbi:unnamed protein product [Plasmodium vivax]|uniref:(malaria parasite P. vivax) hypothetical protein n=1 Tax=Plasmodium vivax TaxID=5855 RepID=A0A8S4HJ87_PLAVI|nr:unnamed protein product [Plasmodium vivax]
MFNNINTQITIAITGITVTSNSLGINTLEDGKSNSKYSEGSEETFTQGDIISRIFNFINYKMSIKTYIIAAFLPFVIFLLWKFLIKYTPLSILVDKKKKKKRKKMNARLERILLDPSYQREKNIPLAYSPYEYYTY